MLRLEIVERKRRSEMNKVEKSVNSYFFFLVVFMMILFFDVLLYVKR